MSLNVALYTVASYISRPDGELSQGGHVVCCLLLELSEPHIGAAAEPRRI